MGKLSVGGLRPRSQLLVLLGSSVPLQCGQEQRPLGAGRGCARMWLVLGPHGLWEHRVPLLCEPRVTPARVCFSGNVRISDLGLAVELKDGQMNTKGYAGTPGKFLRAGVGLGGLGPRGPRGLGRASQ